MKVYQFEYSTPFFKSFESFCEFTEAKDIDGKPRHNFIVWQGPGFYEVQKKEVEETVEIHGHKITTDEYIARKSVIVSEASTALTQARVDIIFAYQKQAEGIE